MAESVPMITYLGPAPEPLCPASVSLTVNEHPIVAEAAVVTSMTIAMQRQVVRADSSRGAAPVLRVNTDSARGPLQFEVPLWHLQDLGVMALLETVGATSFETICHNPVYLLHSRHSSGRLSDCATSRADQILGLASVDLQHAITFG